MNVSLQDVSTALKNSETIIILLSENSIIEIKITDISFLLLGFYKQSLAIEFEELTTNKGISFWFVKIHHYH